MNILRKVRVVGIFGGKSELLLESSTAIEIEDLLNSPEVKLFISSPVWERMWTARNHDDYIFQVTYGQRGAIQISNSMTFAEMHCPSNMGWINFKWVRFIIGEEISYDTPTIIVMSLDKYIRQYKELES